MILLIMRYFQKIMKLKKNQLSFSICETYQGSTKKLVKLFYIINLTKSKYSAFKNLITNCSKIF